MYANKRAMKALIGVNHQIIGTGILCASVIAEASMLFIKNIPPRLDF